MKKRTLLLGCLMAGFAIAASAAPYVILSNDRPPLECIRLRAKPDGTLVVTRKDGNNMEIPKGRYVKAVADRPPELDPAVRAIQSGKLDEGIAALEKIAKEYKYLDWDIVAQKHLADALVKKGDPEAAVRAYNAIFQTSEEEKNNLETQWGYRRAMLAAKQYAALGRQLDQVVSGGPRIEAAKAQNMRGDIELAQNNLESALLEYLRTALLFEDLKDPQAGQVLGEACAKAADLLAKMHDPDRAGEMRRKAQQYGYDPSKAR